ncbi:hypothetical protein [Tahibacter harae]|uniref:Uncharacterized protein n=1 Tax=Tahibacter harae TaxID=2963937 RepID=A0ABT1QY88_9GAMM|nr:hypothetical protein [Tahibacter harae]MCQ4167258.1 hypothetical protein [Tahibacter harae]
MIDLFNAERVITPAALGKTAKAAELLRQVLPRLQAHGELETIRRCAAATLARPPGGKPHAVAHSQAERGAAS